MDFNWKRGSNWIAGRWDSFFFFPFVYRSNKQDYMQCFSGGINAILTVSWSSCKIVTSFVQRSVKHALQRTQTDTLRTTLLGNSGVVPNGTLVTQEIWTRSRANPQDRGLTHQHRHLYAQDELPANAGKLVHLIRNQGRFLPHLETFCCTSWTKIVSNINRPNENRCSCSMRKHDSPTLKR